jgi:hypothetical protein
MFSVGGHHSGHCNGEADLQLWKTAPPAKSGNCFSLVRNWPHSPILAAWIVRMGKTAETKVKNSETFNVSYQLQWR